MAPSRKVATRIAALFGGAVVTIFLAPWGLAFTLALAMSPELQEAAVGVTWGLSTVLGIIAFWVWFFSKEPLSPKRRLLITIGLGFGVLAVAPILTSVAVFAFWSVVGVATVLVVLLEMWLPNKAFETDGSAGGHASRSARPPLN